MTPRKGLVAGSLLVLAALSASAIRAEGIVPLCVAPAESTSGLAHSLNAEIARTPDERRLGLMDRQFLAPDQGMLFVFREDRSASSGFWMYRTLIPLDIAYLNAKGTIIAIRNMTPCPPAQGTHCPSYEPGRPYRYALEVNSGYFEERNIGVGGRVWASGETGCTSEPQGAVTPLPAR